MMQKLRITSGGVLPGLVKIESFGRDMGEVSHELARIGVSGRTPAILRLAYTQETRKPSGKHQVPKEA